MALHPENDPWQLGVDDVLEATVVRWIERADRHGGAGGYLLALRPAALVILRAQEAGRFKNGDIVAVKVIALDARSRQVTVSLVPWQADSNGGEKHKALTAVRAEANGELFG